MNASVRYALLALAGIALVVYNPLTWIAANYNREVLIGGTAIYASLRQLASIMSVVRDTDFSASTGFAAVVTSPGQALQPVIGTIERMANLLFALVIASGVLGFTLPIVAGLGAAVLAIGSTVKAVALFAKVRLPGALDRLARSAVALGGVAAICIPMAYASAFFLGDRFIADAWNKAADVFDRQSEALSIETVSGSEVVTEPADPGPPVEPAPATEGNVLDWAKSTIGGAVQGSADAVQGALAATTGFATAVRDHIGASARVVTDGVDMAIELFQASIDIGVAYLVKLIVLPLLLLAGIIWLFRSLIRPDLPILVERPVDLLPKADPMIEG